MLSCVAVETSVEPLTRIVFSPTPTGPSQMAISFVRITEHAMLTAWADPRMATADSTRAVSDDFLPEAMD